MLAHFFTTNDESLKKELIKSAIEKVVSSRIMMPIEKFKDNQSVYFGDTGYLVHNSTEIPEDLNWMFMAIELDNKTRSNSELLSSILTEENISEAMDIVSALSAVSNPVATAITKLVTLLGKQITTVFKNDRDDQAGLFLASFIRKVHYINGKRDREDVPDLTSNMFLDYTIFAFEE